MTKLFWNRRVVLAAASVALAGGGLALPATAMAASAAPQHGMTLAPQNDNGNAPRGIEGAYHGNVDVNLDSESRQGPISPSRDDDGNARGGNNADSIDMNIKDHLPPEPEDSDPAGPDPAGPDPAGPGPFGPPFPYSPVPGGDPGDATLV
ncbi:hypothetical protein [Streptomyces sp. NPDC057686]|uniref:hypothetical protein n=1 Tax=Streptomyces sp. NPDC057686 TaxID=3346212 RepID=UPI00367CE490